MLERFPRSDQRTGSVENIVDNVKTYGLLINVDLDERDVLEGGFGLLEMGRNHLAGTTPDSP